jgi:hypothetical protein
MGNSSSEPLLKRVQIINSGSQLESLLIFLTLYIFSRPCRFSPNLLASQPTTMSSPTASDDGRFCHLLITCLSTFDDNHMHSRPQALAPPAPRRGVCSVGLASSSSPATSNASLPRSRLLKILTTLLSTSSPLICFMKNFIFDSSFRVL